MINGLISAAQSALAWFNPAAPDVGAPDSNIVPENSWFDPLAAARTAAYTHEHVGPGYHSSWKFVAPPGFGDAPQHVFSTFTLIPLSVDGAGDRPRAYLSYLLPQSLQPLNLTDNGMAINSGVIQLRGLYDASQQLAASAVISGGT